MKVKVNGKRKPAPRKPSGDAARALRFTNGEAVYIGEIDPNTGRAVVAQDEDGWAIRRLWLQMTGRGKADLVDDKGRRRFHIVAGGHHTERKDE